MSAEVETMMYVREVPWHGLGTRVETAPTSADALRLSGLDWTVERKLVFDGKGNSIPGYRATTRTTDNKVFGIVSDRYQVVQNRDAFSFTDALLSSDEEKVVYETAGSLRNGKTVWLLARMTNQKILGDDVTPYLVFTNNHDGKGSVKVCMTPVRVVCNNTLNIALKEATRSWTTRHIGQMSAKLEEAQITLGLAKDYMAQLNIEASKLADLKVSQGEIEHMLDIMYPVDNKSSERRVKNTNAVKDAFFTCYNMSDISKFKGTAWGVINATSDLISHFAPARQTATYQENNWGKIIVGHPLLDLAYSSIAA